VQQPREVYASLDEPWQLALAEAWTSWVGGSAGVGAVISRTSTGDIVAVGRNRMLEPRRDPGVLASTLVAHAEMNALAVLPIGPADDLTLSTTFEPCLMCASTIIQQRIPRVRYAAADPQFDGMHDWFTALPFARERLPEREELGGRVGAFAHVLHLSWLSFWVDAPTIDAHRRIAPGRVELARDVIDSNNLAAIGQDGGTVVDALTALWPSLADLATGPAD
jgi:tRNA(Arg) A34 adenosine deaminase TadA